MGLTDEQPVTHLTDIHKKVSKRIERLGILVRDEVPFPPYTADIYLDEYHAVVEIDGPHHNEKKDLARDKALWDKYRVYTLRIKMDQAKNSFFIRERVLAFLEEIEVYDSFNAVSLYARIQFAEDNGWQS